MDLHQSNDRNVTLTLAQVGERHQVGVKTIRRWIADGRLPKPIRIGARSPRIRLSTLLDFEQRSMFVRRRSVRASA